MPGHDITRKHAERLSDWLKWVLPGMIRFQWPVRHIHIYRVKGKGSTRQKGNTYTSNKEDENRWSQDVCETGKSKVHGKLGTREAGNTHVYVLICNHQAAVWLLEIYTAVLIIGTRRANPRPMTTRFYNISMTILHQTKHRFSLEMPYMWLYLQTLGSTTAIAVLLIWAITWVLIYVIG